MKGSILLPINIQGHWEPEQREGQLMVEPHDPKKGMPPKNDEVNWEVELSYFWVNWCVDFWRGVNCICWLLLKNCISWLQTIKTWQKHELSFSTQFSVWRPYLFSVMVVLVVLWLIHCFETFVQETMSKEHAMRFPFIGSAVLLSLFLLFKFLPKDLINTVLTLYFFVLGVLALS